MNFKSYETTKIPTKVGAFLQNLIFRTFVQCATVTSMWCAYVWTACNTHHRAQIICFEFLQEMQKFILGLFVKWEGQIYLVHLLSRKCPIKIKKILSHRKNRLIYRVCQIFPHSLYFLILSPLPLHFLILSPFSRSLAARLPKVMQPCSAHNKRTAVESGCVLRSAEFNWVPLFILASLSFHCTVPRTPGQRTVPYGNIYEKHLQRIHLEDSSQEAYSYRAYFDKQ